MKLYLLHGDMSEIHGYRERDCETEGYEAYVYGIFDTREKAEEAKERNLGKFYRPNPDQIWIEEIELNKDIDLRLGGYIEFFYLED